MTRHEELMIKFQGQELMAFVRVYVIWGADDPSVGYKGDIESLDWVLLSLSSENDELPRIFYLNNQVELDKLIEDELHDVACSYTPPEREEW